MCVCTRFCFRRRTGADRLRGCISNVWSVLVKSSPFAIRMQSVTRSSTPVDVVRRHRVIKFFRTDVPCCCCCWQPDWWQSGGWPHFSRITPFRLSVGDRCVYLVHTSRVLEDGPFRSPANDGVSIFRSSRLRHLDTT